MARAATTTFGPIPSPLIFDEITPQGFKTDRAYRRFVDGGLGVALGFPKLCWVGSGPVRVNGLRTPVGDTVRTWTCGIYIPPAPFIVW